MPTHLLSLGFAALFLCESCNLAEAGSPVVPAREALEIGEKYVASKQLPVERVSLSKLEAVDTEGLSNGTNDRILPSYVLTFKVKDKSQNTGELYICVFRDLSVDHAWGFWQLSASCDKEHYRPGESPLLKVTLTNTAPEASQLMVGNLLYDYSVTVLRDGAILPISRKALVRAINAGSKGQSIQTGKSLEVSTDLGKALQEGHPLKPGRYIVFVQRNNRKLFRTFIGGDVSGEAVATFTVGTN